MQYPTGKNLTYTYNAAQKRTGMVDPDCGLTSWTYGQDLGVIQVVGAGGASAVIGRAGFANYPIYYAYDNLTMNRTLEPNEPSEYELNRNFVNSPGTYF